MMRDPAGELADRLHFPGLAQGVLGLAENLRVVLLRLAPSLSLPVIGMAGRCSTSRPTST